VIVKARDDVGAAADERLKRLGSAREILQLDGEPFVAIVPELLRERRRPTEGSSGATPIVGRTPVPPN
jgi:hypothetical protein